MFYSSEVVLFQEEFGRADVTLCERVCVHACMRVCVSVMLHGNVWMCVIAMKDQKGTGVSLCTCPFEHDPKR